MKLQIREILSRPVSELLKARQVIKCTPETSIAEAVKLIREKKVGSIVIADGLRVLGIFTERDFLEKIALQESDPFKTSVDTYMTPNPVCMARQESLGAVLKKMREGRFRHILIVDAYQNLENIISLREIMDYALAAAGESLDSVLAAEKKAA